MNNKYEKCINDVNDYINKLTKLSLENPDMAKKIARQDMVRTGIIDEFGNLKYPYDGSCEDFSIGPKYNHQIGESQTVSELVGDLNNKTQVRIRK